MSETTTEDGGHIVDTPLAEALSERYLAYALSTIMSRSLPDVRDGLKPVHRRLLYGMHQLRLDPAAAFKKCARIVGDVMGKFHPHGDASIYDALVRLAQDFSTRFPLIEGQGNFGNVDGDNPAAFRYTEARLTEAARALLAGIDDDAVDFRPTYNGEEGEPVILPGAFPNLLANGSTGIAVGMATSIPPHNVGEVCAAAIHRLRHPGATAADLLVHMPGPDFPTGGIIVEDKAAIRAAYETGRGGFRTRARWAVEQGRNATWTVVVTEIPYQVQKSRLVEQIAGLLEAKRLPLLADVRDESAAAVRLVLEPRSRNVEPEALMATLFRMSDLETRFPLNLNVLTGERVPRVLGLPEVLGQWLEHLDVVLVRRTQHRLGAVERRLEVLEGFLRAFVDVDEVIHIIRTEDEPRPVLMARLDLSELQAEAILNLRLRSLRRLEEMELKREHKTLATERKALAALLDGPGRRRDRIEADLRMTAEKFGAGALGTRRTTFSEAAAVTEVAPESLIERAAVTVVLSDRGWLRAVRGHVEVADLKFKDGDRLRFAVPCQTTDRLCLFATDGRTFSLRAGTLPGAAPGERRGDGQPMRVLLDLPAEADAAALFLLDEARRYLVAGDGGRGFVVDGAALVAEKRTGKQVLTLRPGEQALLCVPAVGDMVAVVGEGRKLLVFPLEDVPVMARGAGVALIKLRDGRLVDAQVFRREAGLAWWLGERTRVEPDTRPWQGARGTAGRAVPNGFPRSGRFS